MPKKTYMRGGIRVSTCVEETCQMERLDVDVERKPNQLTLGTLDNPHDKLHKEQPNSNKNLN